MSTHIHPPAEREARTKVGVGRAWSTAGQHTAWPGRGPGIPQEEGQQVRREGGKGSASRLSSRKFTWWGGARESTGNLRLRRVMCWDTARSQRPVRAPP